MNERSAHPPTGTGAASHHQLTTSSVSPAAPTIRYVVHVDLSPAVDHHGCLDEHEATQIAYRCSDFPPGATVRLFIGSASSAHLPRLAELLRHAGVIELIGSNPRGLRHVGDSLAGVDPFALQVVDS